MHLSLPIVLDSFANVKFMDVTIAVGSQVVLQWLLADNIGTKSVFISNRVKAIAPFKKSYVTRLWYDHPAQICKE